MIQFAPDIFFENAAFPTAFRVAIAALALIHSDIIFCALDLIRAIVTHDSLDPADHSPPPKFPLYAATIRQTVSAEGPQLTGHILAGIVGDFPEESVSTVVTIFRMLAVLWSEELLVWLPQVLNQLPTTTSFVQAKQQLLEDVTTYVHYPNAHSLYMAVRINLIVELYRTDKRKRFAWLSSHFIEHRAKRGKGDELCLLISDIFFGCVVYGYPQRNRNICTINEF